MYSGSSGLLEPLLLLALIPCMLVCTIVVRGARTRSSRCEKLGIGSPAHSTPFLLFSILFLLVAALARPFWGSEESTVPDSESEYQFLVDVSRSMLAKDVPPSRLTLAKRKMRDIIDAFASQGVPQRYGITIFAGSGYVLCPSTTDTAVVKQFIDEISPDMVSSLGSQITLGLRAAVGSAPQRDLTTPPAYSGSSKRILLVSDGEDGGASVHEAVELIRNQGTRVDVLGVGTREGATIPLGDGSVVQDASGSPVHSRLHEDFLQTVAAAAGGVYVPATIDDSDVSRLATRAEHSLPQLRESGGRQIITYRELGPFLCAAALATLGFLLIWRRQIVLSLLFLLPIMALTALDAAQAGPPEESSTAPSTRSTLTTTTARTGFELYHQGQFAESLAVFQRALEADPSDVAIRQAYASALFKTGNYKEAATMFRAVAESTTNGKQYFENTYNQGNALLAGERYQDAIDAYTRALDVKQGDERVSHNLAIARARLEQERSKRTAPNPSQQQDTQGHPPQSPSPSPSQAAASSQQPLKDQDPPHATPSPSDPTPDTATPTASTSEQPPQESHGASDDNGHHHDIPDEKTVSGTPSPTEPHTAAAVPTANPNPNPESPHPAHATGARQREADMDKSEENSPNIQPQASLPTTAPEYGAPLSEAEAWLESLPESPLIITKERGTRASSGQSW